MIAGSAPANASRPASRTPAPCLRRWLRTPPAPAFPADVVAILPRREDALELAGLVGQGLELGLDGEVGVDLGLQQPDGSVLVEAVAMVGTTGDGDGQQATGLVEEGPVPGIDEGPARGIDFRAAEIVGTRRPR